MSGVEWVSDFRGWPVAHHQQLAGWLGDCLPGGVAANLPLELAPLRGDAGFRQYYRAVSRPSLIATYAPPETENTLAFVTKGLALARSGAHVPRVYAVDYRRGFVAQEDLGEALMLAGLAAANRDLRYGAALDALARIQTTACDPAVFPAYSAALLRDEMALFPRWLIQALLEIELTPEEQALLADLFDLLTESASAQPRVVVHRDYHSRNLLLLDDGDVGIVDFQDAVVGPVSYDLVSLLRDCYHRLPEVDLVRYRDRYLAAAQRAGLLRVETDQFARWFDFMGLQRHIKVLGIFCRLWLRDGKSAYLKDLPLVIRYVLEVAARHSETRPFAAWFEARLVPSLAAQPWYSPWDRAGETCAP
ncbi:MAG: aminoglycoside phosphotransferase family protein [Porticoccaceae bacterium]